MLQKRQKVLAMAPFTRDPKRSSSEKAIPNARLQSGLQSIEEIGTIQI
jgi:hypothetical protein